MSDCSWGRAVVVGASMAGLLAARVLADYFSQVTIIERDALPTQVEARKGVPQGKHVHLLMIRGADIIAELFPGIFTELEAAGSLPVSPTEDFHWYHLGGWKLQFPGPLHAYSQSRPLLEDHVRRRVLENAAITLLEGTVEGFCHESGAITGVKVCNTKEAGANSDVQIVHADLVVDASGRGSQTPRWLESLGYPAVAETLIKVNVGYATRLYQRIDERRNWKLLGIYPWPVGKMKRTGYLFPIEGDRWVVTLSGILGDHPSSDEQAFLDFAQSLAQPDIYTVIKDAEPLTPVETYKFSRNQRRHYERCMRFPEGLVILGDAVCSLNPIYGQGMTLAALGALTLCKRLAQQQRALNKKGFSLRFQKALARVIEMPWLLTTSEDFRYAEVEGKRPFCLSVLQGYTKRVCSLTTTDPFVTQTFYEVLNMRKSSTVLFDPRILIPAMFADRSINGD
jgi:2-polyprenyl-6-methoxyphenol hydroxylase-like FAD-dependent oxidoreductase